MIVVVEIVVVLLVIGRLFWLAVQFVRERDEARRQRDEARRERDDLRALLSDAGANQGPRSTGTVTVSPPRWRGAP